MYGGLGCFGNPPTKYLKLFTFSFASIFPSKKFGIPGASPASKTTVILLSLAFLFKDKIFSGENEMSTMFF